MEAYKIKRVSKCKCYEDDDDIGNIMLLSTRKLKRNTRATHVFKASDELVCFIHWCLRLFAFCNILIFKSMKD